MNSPLMQLDIAKLHHADLLQEARNTVMLKEFHEEKIQERKTIRSLRAIRMGRLMAMVIYLLGF